MRTPRSPAGSPAPVSERSVIEDARWCSLAHLERDRSLVWTGGCSHHKSIFYLTRLHQSFVLYTDRKNIKSRWLE